MNISELNELDPWEWPDDAAATLRQTLEDDGAPLEQRVLAAELAGEIFVINEEMAHLLLGLVRRPDVSANLRCVAALALGPCLEEGDTMGFDDEPPLSEEAFRRVVGEMRLLYHDAQIPDEVRRHVLEAAVRAPQDWHAGAIRAAHVSDDPAWRLTAMFCMQYIRGFEAQILETLHSDDEPLLYHAVCAAGTWGLEGAWERVVALALDKKVERDLRSAAIHAAATIRPAAIDAALGELQDDADEQIAEAACDALTLADRLAAFAADDEDFDEDFDDDFDDEDFDVEDLDDEDLDGLGDEDEDEDGDKRPG
jgi:hypothetical protein